MAMTEREREIQAGEAAFHAAMNAGIQPGQISMWRMTEAQLHDEVLSRCERLGIACVYVDNVHHTRRRGQLQGFPDMELHGRNGVAYRELKREAGYLNPKQNTWKYRLLAEGQDWGLWKPSDLIEGRIDQELAALSGR